MTPRTPLGSCVSNTPLSTRPPSLKTTGVMGSIDAHDELTYKAVARSASAMAKLGAPAKAAKDSVPGALALRALGFGYDGSGNATYNPAAGSVSSQLLVLKQAVRAEHRR